MGAFVASDLRPIQPWALLLAHCLLSGCGESEACDDYISAADSCMATWGLDQEASCDPAAEANEEYLSCMTEVYTDADCSEADAYLAMRPAIQDCSALLVEEE